MKKSLSRIGLIILLAAPLTSRAETLYDLALAKAQTSTIQLDRLIELIDSNHLSCEYLLIGHDSNKTSAWQRGQLDPIVHKQIGDDSVGYLDVIIGHQYPDSGSYLTVQDGSRVKTLARFVHQGYNQTSILRFGLANNHLWVEENSRFPLVPRVWMDVVYRCTFEAKP